MQLVRLLGVLVCLALMAVVVWRAMLADHTTYLLYLLAASLLGVLAGVFNNLGKM